MFGKHLLVIALVMSGLAGSGSNVQDHNFLASADKAKLAQRPGTYSSLFSGPDKIYEKVWYLIKEEYYDTSYNGQDWQRWLHKYDGKLNTLDDAHKAVETMLASLGDRYTRFLDQDAFDDERSQIDAQICGIGVQIGTNKEHKIVVISPIEDTPAAKAGVRAADEIMEIDGQSTSGFSVDDAAKHIRGPVNSTVDLMLRRKGKRIKISIMRAEIPLKAVQTAKLLDSDIAYIRLTSFISQKADQEVADAIKNLPSAKGVILDLRDNPGGLLNNAITISNMFLPSGNVVSTVDRDGYKQSIKSSGRPLCELPMAVLINKGSASASEITSGALRDNNRAVLVGEKTFGKGLVQGINRLEDGTGVNITIARYLTPNDTDINQKGIVPDVEVKVSKDDEKDHKGPWWLDPDGPTVTRKPEDMKDAQLKRAIEVVRKNIEVPTEVAMKHAVK
ncbi:MAG: S41 family peptidase [Cyanobacteria bacterium]|nr:S41 family peptidase [Cyanobacteriota bacterium]